MGRTEEVHAALEQLLQLLPGLTLNDTKAQLPFKDNADMARYLDGLSTAGLSK